MSKAVKVEQLDQLVKGQYVMLRRTDDEDQHSSYDEMFGRRRGKPVATGPFKIVATDFPFIVIEVSGRREIIDVHNYHFYIVSRSIARAMGLMDKDSEYCSVADGRPLSGSKPKTRTKRDKPSKDACPNCGRSKTRQRLLKIEGVMRWVHYCPECGKYGNPVDAT
jgi:rubredoxin